MGAAHSTEPRSVSMENPNPGVIDISDEVVQRLKKGINKQGIYDTNWFPNEKYIDQPLKTAIIH